MTTILKKGQPIQGNSQKVKYVKYKELKVGDQVVLGTYVKVDMVQAMDPKKPNVPQHTFETDEGITILNSSKDLNEKLEKVEFGTLLDIVFTAKKKVKTKEGHTIFPYEFEVTPLEIEAA